MAQHPDREFVGYILRGMSGGFRIGFDHQRYSCKPAHSNMKSATENAGVVEEYLLRELTAGRVVGPFARGSIPAIQISPFGVIPKSEPEKWRLIVDLSSPEGGSVNDGIGRELCSLSYVRVDDIVSIILKLGRGTLLAKFDVQAMYRTVPVHPDNRHLLGMMWKEEMYVDTTLPFGLRSAPKIFNAIAEAVEWVMKARHHYSDAHYLDAHYLDDYIILPRSKRVCGQFGEGSGSVR